MDEPRVLSSGLQLADSNSANHYRRLKMQDQTDSPNESRQLQPYMSTTMKQGSPRFQAFPEDKPPYSIGKPSQAGGFFTVFP